MQKLDVALKATVKEKDRLKLKMIRLSNAKRQIITNAKTCKNCQQEFKDTENFNWSCRTHQSDWGGAVWWCCGKNNRDQPGCKFNKHVSKEEHDDLDDENGNSNKIYERKLIRCSCCKQMSHSIENCKLDPNLKTTNDIL